MRSSEPTLAPRIALRPREAAEALGVSDRTLRKWMHDDGLPFLRIDGCVLIPCGQLEEWLAERVESEHRTEELVGEVLDGL